MKQHLLQQHFTSILHTQGYHGQAVADKDHLHAREVPNMTAGEVVSCDHGYGLTGLVQ